MGFLPAKTYQKALFDAGMPLTSFADADVAATYERLKKLGVVFHTPPTKMGPVTIAVFEDTCASSRLHKSDHTTEPPPTCDAVPARMRGALASWVRRFAVPNAAPSIS